MSTGRHCRACLASGLETRFDFGSQPAANALLESRVQKEEIYPLNLVQCPACALLQLNFDVPHEKLFNGNYPYFSGQSKQWVAHCAAYAQMIYARLGLGRDCSIAEIGGNDGTLLANFRGKAFFLNNIEPSESVADAARAKSVPVTAKCWSRDIVLPYKADLLIANNVMAHDPDLRGFVAAIGPNLTPHGTFTAEFPWALRMIEDGKFDTIYHEHYSYLALRPLMKLFAHYGLNIYDVEELPTHGGSLRIYASSYALRPACTEAVFKALDREKALEEPKTFWEFGAQAWKARDAFETFLAAHGPIYAYGAAAKGNTFLNWLELSYKDVLLVGDTTPAKQGKFLPGSHIPVVEEAYLLAQRPEYVLILPWNWTDEVADKLHCIRGWGGQFVTAVPELRVF